MKRFIDIFFGVLAIVVGSFVLYLVNVVGKIILKAIFGPGLNQDAIPLTSSSQIGFLIMTFIAGFFAAFIIVLLSKKNAWIHLGVFCLLALILDSMAIQGQFVELPIWAKATLIGSVPVQIWLGGIVGQKIKRSKK